MSAASDLKAAFVRSTLEAAALEHLTGLRAEINSELNRRLPARGIPPRRLELVDRAGTFEVNLAEVEAAALLEGLDALALELRHRSETFGPLMSELGQAGENALAASMRGLSDDQIAMLVEQAATIERVAGVALDVQLERSTRAGEVAP